MSDFEQTPPCNGHRIPPEPEGKFPLGRQMVTPNALARVPVEEMFACLIRHHTGDWGGTDEHDTAANNRALLEGTRLFSVYHTQAGEKFWIITEADRSVTTVLMPEDY